MTSITLIYNFTTYQDLSCVLLSFPDPAVTV
eukprot:CAMPEP_0119112578 /NCGR_PEP_ID=MMETSP1180-20130426/40857_1 /TAXON_ID=3052 ORGANISM="Chlamydomonas cf sp, Strain CCMP681" /NCGR_SAMPLE_ID=MMETSP1180 /ASSEMBLY_ACC=CAM_ASM_000741 /LENGTH=30 /DNA_ID= /DNA_START= /DNA_END= /DNA_ORIENTATION=